MCVYVSAIIAAYRHHHHHRHHRHHPSSWWWWSSSFRFVVVVVVRSCRQQWSCRKLTTNGRNKTEWRTGTHRASARSVYCCMCECKCATKLSYMYVYAVCGWPYVFAFCTVCVVLQLVVCWACVNLVCARRASVRRPVLMPLYVYARTMQHACVPHCAS